jgi:hypothetical protein
MTTRLTIVTDQRGRTCLYVNSRKWPHTNRQVRTTDLLGYGPAKVDRIRTRRTPGACWPSICPSPLPPALCS